MRHKESNKHSDEYRNYRETRKESEQDEQAADEFCKDHQNEGKFRAYTDNVELIFKHIIAWNFHPSVKEGKHAAENDTQYQRCQVGV